MVVISSMPLDELDRQLKEDILQSKNQVHYKNINGGFKMKQGKKFYKSKTFWINLLLVVGGIIVGIADSLTTGAVITIPAVANLILRHLTDSAIDWSV